MQRRRLELEADRAVGRQRVEEVIRVDGLRRAGEAVDRARGMIAAQTTVGCRNVRLPTSAMRIRARALRSSKRGRADRAAGGRRTSRARTVTRCVPGDVPSASIATHSSAVTRSRSMTKRCARTRVTSVAPRASASGIVVTSIDCFAFSRAADAAIAEVRAAAHVAADHRRRECRACAAPRASAALFSFGGTSHGAIDEPRFHASRTTAPGRVGE